MQMFTAGTYRCGRTNFFVKLNVLVSVIYSESLMIILLVSSTLVSFSDLDL